MAESARIHQAPAGVAAPTSARPRPALYADYLPEQPMRAPPASPRWPNLRWARLQLARGLVVAGVVFMACLLIWSRR